MSDHTPNVLMLRSSAGFYGAERVVVTLASQLNHDSVKTVVGTFENDLAMQQLFIDNLKSEEVPTEIIPSSAPFSLKAIRHIILLCQKYEIDVIHTNDYKSTVHGLIAAKKLGIRICATSHGAILNSFKLKLYHFIETEAYKFIDAVAVVSSDMLNTLTSKAIRRNKLHLIHNAIDTDKFSPMPREDVYAIREQLGIPTKDWVFCNVGRLSAEKGHADLIDAFAQFHQRHPHSTLLIVGDGELEFDIKRQIRTQKLHDSVHCLGARSDIEKMYGVSDCYVSSSHTEGMPMVILEAMSCGLPVIATKVGEVSNIIESALCGYLTEPKNTSGLAQQMEKIHATKKLESLTERAREYAVSHFSTTKQATEYLALYRAIQR